MCARVSGNCANGENENHFSRGLDFYGCGLVVVVVDWSTLEEKSHRPCARTKWQVALQSTSLLHRPAGRLASLAWIRLLIGFLSNTPVLQVLGAWPDTTNSVPSPLTTARTWKPTWWWSSESQLLSSETEFLAPSCIAGAQQTRCFWVLCVLCMMMLEHAL